MASSEKVLVIDLSKAHENQKLLDGKPQTHGMRSGRVYLQSGQACGEHSTKEREEVLVFLSGRGELIIAGKERYNVGEGKVSYIPPLTPHDIRNTGDKPLVYIYCVTPVTDVGVK